MAVLVAEPGHATTLQQCKNIAEIHYAMAQMRDNGLTYEEQVKVWVDAELPVTAVSDFLSTVYLSGRNYSPEQIHCLQTSACRQMAGVEPTDILGMFRGCGIEPGQ